MAVVILPLLPEGPSDPDPGFRPRTLWIARTHLFGTQLSRLYRKKGAPRNPRLSVAGILGGVISSTAVTFSFCETEPVENLQRRVAGHRRDCRVYRSLCTGLIATATLNPMLARGGCTIFHCALCRRGSRDGAELVYQTGQSRARIRHQESAAILELVRWRSSFKWCCISCIG